MYVDMINESSNHLMQVLDNIIEFSYVDSGLVKVTPKNIDLKELFDELNQEMKDMQRLMQKENLQISINNQLPQGIEIYNDKARLKQILSNLLSNAIKFTEQGGVTFKVSYTSNKWVVFSVLDTGIGIPKDQHELIFRRFRQVDEGSTRMFGGNGLGIPLSKYLAQMMGGHISFQSQPGEGSHFQLFLPEKLDASLERALSADFVK
jgi:hypothetical protein